MNSLKSYLDLTRRIFTDEQTNSDKGQNLATDHSMLAFRETLTCRICQNLLRDPQTMANCKHIVCKACINNTEELPALTCCLDAVVDGPNNQMAILLKLYRSLCDYWEEHKQPAPPPPQVVETYVEQAEEVEPGAVEYSEIEATTISTTGTVLAEVIDQEDNSYMEELPIYTIKKEIEDIDLIQPGHIKIEEIDQFMSFSPSPPPVSPPAIKIEPEFKLTTPLRPPFQRSNLLLGSTTVKTEAKPHLLTNVQRTKILTTTLPKSSPQSKILVTSAVTQPTMVKTYMQKPMHLSTTHLLKQPPSPKPMFSLRKGYTTAKHTPKNVTSFGSSVLQLQKPDVSGMSTSTSIPKVGTHQLMSGQKSLSKINIISIERTNIPTSFTASNTVAAVQAPAPPLPVTTAYSSQIQAPIKTVSNGSTMYQVMYNGSGNKITIKRKIEPDEPKSYGGGGSSGGGLTVTAGSSSPSGSGSNSFKKPISQSKPIMKRRGCRCGCATATPGKLTCCGQRCPCYVDSKSCVDCKCRGCRNPHRADGLKVRPLIPELENLEINLMEKPNYQYTNNHRLNLQLNAFKHTSVSSSNTSSSSSSSSNNSGNNSITTTLGGFTTQPATTSQVTFTCVGLAPTTTTMSTAMEQTVQQPQFQQFTTIAQPRVMQQQTTQFTTTSQSAGQIIYEQPSDSMLFNTNNIQVLGVYTTHSNPLSDTQTVLLDDPANQFLQLYPNNHQINQIIYDDKQQHFIMDGAVDDEVDIE